MAKKNIPDPTAASLKGEFKVNKQFGAPMKKSGSTAIRRSTAMQGKMAPDKIAKRKKTMVKNAAGKIMGGLYSK